MKGRGKKHERAVQSVPTGMYDCFFKVEERDGREKGRKEREEEGDAGHDVSLIFQIITVTILKSGFRETDTIWQSLGGRFFLSFFF